MALLLLLLRRHEIYGAATPAKGMMMMPSARSMERRKTMEKWRRNVFKGALDDDHSDQIWQQAIAQHANWATFVCTAFESNRSGTVAYSLWTVGTHFLT